MPTKRALIIGINKYLFMEPQFQLKGCVNDAKLMSNVLINKFNFNPANIVILLDEQATLAAILEAMEHFAQTIEKDDIFVFHFSGHGNDCEVHSEFTDEGTGKDNCIVPCDDCEIGPDEKTIYREVRDQQFSDWLARIANKTSYTTLIFDACYAGTMTRSSEPTTSVRCIPSYVRAGSRAVPNLRSDVSAQMDNLTSSTSSQAAPSLSTNEQRGAGGWLTRSDHYTVMSGSRDTQKAKEWHFDIGGQTVRHGMLSFFLARALIRAKPLSTYRDIFEEVCAGVVSMVTEQNPQIEGAIDREVFGVKDIEPLNFMPVVTVDGTALTLTGGAAHGVQPNSKWQVYPPGSKVADVQECLGVIQIARVEGLSCSANIIQRLGEIVVGARAIEIESAKASEPFNVDISDIPEPFKTQFESKINASKLLAAVTSSKAAQVNVDICDSQTQLNQTQVNAPSHRGPFPVWVLVEHQDQLCMQVRSVSDPDALDIIYSNLEKMAKFRNVLQLSNPRSKLKVECNLLRVHSNGSTEMVNGGSSEFAEHELMCIDIKNNEPANTTPEKSVFFTILWLGADRQIMHFYPRNRACEELAPQQTVRIGSLQSRLSASLPPNHFSDVGSITWKVIFSSTESDFGLLSQDGLRSSTTASHLDAFDIAFTGEAKPSHTEHETNQDPVEVDWCAINRSFILKKAEPT